MALALFHAPTDAPAPADPSRPSWLSVLWGLWAFLSDLCVESVVNRFGNPSTPNSARITAASSSSLAARLLSGRLVKRMPGTESGSMQWSPFHSSWLSVITSGMSRPRADSFVARGEVTLLLQPRVEVEGAPPAREPVVRHHDERGPLR